MWSFYLNNDKCENVFKAVAFYNGKPGVFKSKESKILN